MSAESRNIPRTGERDHTDRIQSWDQDGIHSYTKFDAHGKLLEEKEGSREDWVTATRWRSRTTYSYDELARLISATELWLFDPPVQVECVLSYSTIGNLALIIRSVDKRFKGASLYVHVSGKLVKEINYDAPTMLPSGVNTLQYSINKDGMTVEWRHMGNARYSKRIYNERDEVVKFEAYEDDQLIAYETFVYNDRGDLIDYAHYRPDNILVWRHVFRYEYDEADNWTSREYTQTGESNTQFQGSTSRTTRAIAYYSNQP